MEAGVIVVQRKRTDHTIETVKLAEEVGFDFVGLGDSQSIFRELYSTLGIVARETEDIRLGPTVTQPVTRHPAVTASSMCTVDEVSGGRTFLGLATGDSSVYTLGKRPTKLSELEDVVELFQALSRGESYRYKDAEIRLRWVQESNMEHDIPVIVAAEGPKTLRLAGSMADGVLIGTGLEPAVLRRSVALVEQGAQEAGRNPDEVTKWMFAKVNVADDRQAAIEEIRMALAASANHAFRFTFENKGVPAAFEDAIEELQSEYVPHAHEAVGESANRELLEDLEREYPGLTEFLADRFAVVGPAASCIDKLQRLEDAASVDGVLFANVVENDREMIARTGDEILPAIRS